MRIILFVIMAALAACSGKEASKKGDCYLVTDHEKMYWDTVHTKGGTLVLLNDVIRDTMIVDFVAELRDAETGKPIQNAEVEIYDKGKQVSDSSGTARFSGFHNDSGKFNIKLSHPSYSCISIDSLRFRSGQVKWFEVFLKRQ